MSEKITHLTADTFKATIDGATTPVLVDFWAPWCGPCKAIAPILEELAAELAGQITITKVNVDEHGELAAQYGIRAIPTLLLFNKGEIAEQMVGAKSRRDFKASLDRVAA